MTLPPYTRSKVAGSLGAWALFAAAAALLLGMWLIPQSGEVPSYAMESALVFRLERSLAIAVALIAPTLVIGPLLSGALPRKVSSDGIDWDEERDTVVGTLDSVEERLDKLEKALEKMTDLNG
jgi:hypothetical protein